LKKKILVVDDERTIVDIIAYNLEQENFSVVCVYDSSSVFDIFSKTKIDLMLLDIMLPGLNGFDVCKKIHECYDVAIIMLTARAEESDKILGFELGADDYITKPFSMRELIARVKANLKRTERNVTQKIINLGNIKIDMNRYEVYRDNKLISLTPKEFELLEFLVTHPNKVFTREELLDKVWHYKYYGDARTVDVTIRRLRSKIEVVADMPRYILTKRGVGYYFNTPKGFME
jgi:two-component system response regulator VicR